jgi:hypothetical protein
MRGPLGKVKGITIQHALDPVLAMSIYFIVLHSCAVDGSGFSSKILPFRVALPVDGSLSSDLKCSHGDDGDKSETGRP